MGGVAAAMEGQRQSNDEMEDLPSEIIDNFLFLGDVDNASNEHQLRHSGIRNVLNVTTHESLGVDIGLRKLFLYARDEENENISALFSSACDFISGAKQAGERVLV